MACCDVVYHTVCTDDVLALVTGRSRLLQFCCGCGRMLLLLVVVLLLRLTVLLLVRSGGVCALLFRFVS